jgi:hypothetical protein
MHSPPALPPPFPFRTISMLMRFRKRGRKEGFSGTPTVVSGIPNVYVSGIPNVCVCEREIVCVCVCVVSGIPNVCLCPAICNHTFEVRLSRGQMPRRCICGGGRAPNFHQRGGHLTAHRGCTRHLFLFSVARGALNSLILAQCPILQGL